MDPLTIQNHVRSLEGLGSLAGPQEIRTAPFEAPATSKSEGASFGKILAESIDQVNALQAQTDQAIAKLASGEGGSVHQTLLAVQKAEISMRLLVEVRNKVVNAYQEIMRMQV